MKKRTLFISLLTALGITTVAEGSSDEESFIQGSGVVAWPVSKKVVRLGYRNPKASGFEKFLWVNAPRAVVEDSKKRLLGNPNTWPVQRLDNFEGSGKTVVVIFDSANHILIWLVDRNRWVRLNNKGGIAFVDELLGGRMDFKLTTANSRQLKDFALSVSFLYGGPRLIPLNKIDGEAARRGFSDDLLGAERRRSELIKYCADPVIIRRGRDIHLVFNMMTSEGAVDRWTVCGVEDKRFIIRDINRKIVKKKGSFTYVAG